MRYLPECSSKLAEWCRLIFLIFLIVITGVNNVCLSQVRQNALVQYVRANDSVFKWQTDRVSKNETGSFYEVSLASQKWQDLIISHRLIVYIPNHAKYPNTLVLVLRHLYDRSAGVASLKAISDSTGTSSAILYDMPNQPLFNGRVEDDLQAYTFSQYIKSGDESWPLLFPMVKSVVRAMDAIQELSFKERKQPINGFVIAGHSKRGHATWLTAAADDRVKGIIPIAIDVLNSTAQLPHHLEVFGEYSTPSADATRLLEQLKLPRGRRLIEMIDPYSYREHLAVPKLVISATNDDFFPTDALNLYWRGLTGPKWILYLSNADHVRADSDPRINFTAFAFVRAVAANRSLPEVRWELKETPVLLQLRVITDASARKAGIWLANAKTRDFRKSEWGQKPMLQKDAGKMGIKENRREFEITVKRPAEGFSIFYGEIEFVVDGHVFLLTTQTFVAAKS